MPKLVDLTAAPYNLDEGQIAWVEETLADMTLDEQVGQLFTNLFFFGVDEFSGNPYTAEEIIEKFHIGSENRYLSADLNCSMTSSTLRHNKSSVSECFFPCITVYLAAAVSESNAGRFANHRSRTSTMSSGCPFR